MQRQVQKPTIELVERHRDIGEGRTKTVVFLGTVRGLTEEHPEVTVTPGRIAMDRISHINVQPVGQHCSVVWNGDVENPVLSFDGWVDGPVQVLIEAKGR